MIAKIFDGDGKAKISIFVDSIFMKNIGGFDISMREASFVNIEVSLNKLFHNLYGFLIRKCPSFFDDGIEIPIAEFSDDVGVIFGGIDVVEVKAMFGVGKCFERRYLKLEEHLVDGIFEFGHFYNFDADWLAVFIVGAFVDCAGVAFSDVLLNRVCIALDCFHLCYR